MKTLTDALNELSMSNIYPFHMPGHKRNARFASWGLPFDRDITEIDGFDNLHHPEGILLESQNRLSALFGTKKSYFCVNGSTGGILAAVSACVRKNGQILMARNCHKSVYHAVYLRDLRPFYLLPEEDPVYVLNGDIRPEQVERELTLHPGVEAVLITSPTYDGVVSDVRGIARVVHAHGIPLIVDEAHGAHFRFSSCFPDSAADLGADVVIQSFHKTLPALTQTAVLHVCSERICLPVLERFLSVYQTSSPSYILMESLDRCVRFLEEDGEEAFGEYSALLVSARERLGRCERLRLITPGNCFAVDPSRFVLSGLSCNRGGYEVAERLRKDYRIEPEMTTPEYVLALSAVGDSVEGFERLCSAVCAMDESFEKIPDAGISRTGTGQIPLPLFCLPLAEALDGPDRAVPLEESEGEVCAEFVYLYPPGVPLLVPGEKISGEIMDRMKFCMDRGLTIHGMRDFSGRQIRIVERDVWEKYSAL